MSPTRRDASAFAVGLDGTAAVVGLDACGVAVGVDVSEGAPHALSNRATAASLPLMPTLTAAACPAVPPRGIG